MTLEKEQGKELLPESFETKTRSKIRWGWVVAGILLLLLGLFLPYWATYYYAQRGNYRDMAEPKIPTSPTEQSRIYHKKNFKENRQIINDLKSLQNSASSIAFQTKNGTKFKQENYQKAHYTHNKGLKFNILALQFAENKTGNNSDFAEPSPSPPPKSTHEKNRNVFEKIYDWFIGLFKKKKKLKPNKPADVTSLSFSKKTITLPCPSGTQPNDGACSDDQSVQVRTTAIDPENDVLAFNYKVSGGRIIGQGANVTWDLSGVRPGTYTITARVDDNQGTFGKTVTETIAVENCSCRQECSCPTLSVSGPDQPIPQNEPMTFTANVSGGNQDGIIYSWSVSQGTIVSGQGTPVISVDISGLPDASAITTTVSISNTGCGSCGILQDSETGFVASRAAPRFDGVIRGRVIDSSGNGVAGAIVTIRNLQTGFSKNFTAGANGAYLFDDLERGGYSLTASIPGFASVPQQVFLSNLSTEITVNLPIATNGTTPTPTPNVNTNTSADTNSNTNINVNSNVNANSNINANINANTSANGNTVNNTNTAANVNQANKEGTDKLSFDYPVYFLKNNEHTVNLKLDYVEGKVIANTTTTNVNGITTNSTVLPVVIPRPPQNYDIYVEAALIPLENLEEPKLSKGGWQKYVKEFNQQNTPSWQWKLNLDQAAEDREEVRFRLRLDYGFKLKNLPENSPIINQAAAWETDLLGTVGLPWWIRLLTYLSLPGGALMCALGFIKRRVIAGNPELLIVEDEVQCTLYAPSEAKAGDDFLVKVFAHLQEQAEDLAKIAKMTDENLKEQAVKNLDKTIERGSALTFQLSISGMEVDEPIQIYTWNGNVIEVPFIISIRKDCEPGTKFGKVIVSENNIPIGRLTFKVSIVGKINTLQPIDKNLSEEGLKRYQYAFISYASEDRPEVLERVQMLEAARIKYFQDILSIDPGDRWRKELYKHIDKSDVVFLFWSTAASRSEWVEKEILYALERQQGNDTSPPDIIPIIIEGPPPVNPPPSLNFLHFNDKFIYFIYAATAEHKARKGKTN